MQTFITTSWDDGHEADLRVAEMLSRHGLRGTFYVPRAIETGVMSDRQLRELSSQFEIGAHTLNHVFLTDADDATARREIEGSKAWIQDVTGVACTSFCPPAGRFNSRHWRMFREARFRAVRTVEFLSFDPPRPRDGLLEMPTTLQAFDHPAGSYLRNAIKRVAIGNLWRYIIYGRSQDWGAMAERLLERVQQTGGVFHLWGHSWELEQTAQWSRLEEVLRKLGEMSSRASCLSNGELAERFSGSSVGARPPAGSATTEPVH